jgi:hypothetical protein
VTATFTWRKSSHSGGTSGTDCVELAKLPAGRLGIRDSKNVEGGHLVLAPETARSLLDLVKSGKVDL